MTHDEAIAIVDPIALRLTEHFDSVQILASWVDDQKQTHCVKWGDGNWYARQGMAHEFITEDKAREQARELSKALDGDEGDEGGEETV